MTIARGKTIAVIGAGLIGVTLARRLQRDGCRVVLFDPDQPGMGCSFGNAGYVATDEILPLSHGISFSEVLKMLPDPLAPLTIRWRQIFSLIPWFLKFLAASRPKQAAKSAAALAALQKGSLAAWNKLIREEGLSQMVRRNGAMLVFESEAGFARESVKFPFLDQHNVKYEVLTGGQAREMIPELGPKVTNAIFYPRGFHVRDPLAVTRKIFDHFITAGGEYSAEKVTSFDHRGGLLKGLVTGQGRRQADAAVLCAGHQSGELMRLIGIKAPLVAERGYHVVVDHKPLSFDMCLGSHERGFFITPMEDGLRLAGTVEFSPAGKELPANWKRADILAHHLEELMPGVAGAETSRWMGCRPTLPDFLPALGPAPGLENLYLSFGHQHLGLTLAPVCAEILSDLIAEGKTALDISPFDIKRFQ
ncbi:MAG: FAD-binding oxidoreductase [Proteobacteria bacterium]|nr:FAD-binding oxidoreductase [Pseudomonadota bacterium]